MFPVPKAVFIVNFADIASDGTFSRIRTDQSFQKRKFNKSNTLESASNESNIDSDDDNLFRTTARNDMSPTPTPMPTPSTSQILKLSFSTISKVKSTLHTSAEKKYAFQEIFGFDKTCVTYVNFCVCHFHVLYRF